MDTRLIILALLHFVESRTPVRPVPFRLSTTEEECCIGKCRYYRGTISVTKSGIQCQRWDTNFPHEAFYNPEKNPDAGLEENYCRNPSDHKSAWCYTTDSKTRWEACDTCLDPPDDEAKDPCGNCENHGVCKNGDEGFQCHCLVGFYGEHCENDPAPPANCNAALASKPCCRSFYIRLSFNKSAQRHDYYLMPICDAEGYFQPGVQPGSKYESGIIYLDCRTRSGMYYKGMQDGKRRETGSSLTFTCGKGPSKRILRASQRSI